MNDTAPLNEEANSTESEFEVGKHKVRKCSNSEEKEPLGMKLNEEKLEQRRGF